MTPRSLHLLLLLVAGCGGYCASSAPDPEVTMHLTSTAITEGEPIPQRFTCDGEDVSPALAIADVPDHTQAFALIVDDPDAPRGTWVHWVYYDIPRDARAVAEGAGAAVPGESPAMQGRNDFGNLGWGGPCPPPGAAHRYFFKLYALDAPLGLAEGATKAEVESAMRDHVLAEAQLMGTYARAR